MPIRGKSTPVGATEEKAEEPPLRGVWVGLAPEMEQVFSIGLGPNPPKSEIDRRAAELWAYIQGHLIRGVSMVQALQLSDQEAALVNWIGDSGQRGYDVDNAAEALEAVRASALKVGVELPEIEASPERKAIILNPGMSIWLATVFLARARYEWEERQAAKALDGGNLTAAARMPEPRQGTT